QAARPDGSADRERGIQLYNQQQYRNAAEILVKAVKENKADYDAWYYLGLSQAQTKDLKDATKSFETAIKIQPNSAAAHSGLAFVLLLRNKLTPAFAEARLTLSLDSAIADAHYVVGLVQLRMGHETDALAEAETTLKLNRDFAAAYLLKSQVLAKFVASIPLDDKETKEERTKRYREAATALDEYLRRVPNGPLRETW